MKALTEQQVRDYRRNGYLFPIPVLTAAEVAEGMGDHKAGEPLAVESQRDGERIAAQRIVADGLGVGRLEPAEIARAAVVIKDHVAVQIFQFHAGATCQLQPNSLRTFFNPSTRRSTSLSESISVST